MQSLTPSAQAILTRAFDPTEVFTAAELAQIEPVANAVAVRQPADEHAIRQSIGTLAAAMPAQTSGIEAGKLKMGAYLTMLEGCDARALSYACRRCLAELDWMPTIKQLMERMTDWVSAEESMIRRARTIMRAGRREQADPPAITAAGIRALTPEMRQTGIDSGFITQGDVDAAFDSHGADVAGEPRSDYVPSVKAA